MDLVKIKDYENYSFDKNTNQVYRHTKTRLKPIKYNYRSGYLYIPLYKNGIRKHFSLHRFIFKLHNPNIDITNLQIDHIDRDKLNNNIENLRHSNHSENQCNQKIRKDNKNGYKNIKFKKYSYEVCITKNKIIYTKTFKTLEEAILWRDIKLIELHGEFHNLG